MRPFDPALVEAVWQELSAYPEERSSAEARAFVAGQPHLVRLAEALTRGFDREVQKAALGLLFLLVKVIEAHREAPVPAVSAARVAEVYRQTLARLEQGEGAAAEPREPDLARHLLTAFYDRGPESPEPEAEVETSLFLLLRTAADALAAEEDL